VSATFVSSQCHVEREEAGDDRPDDRRHEGRDRNSSRIGSGHQLGSEDAGRSHRSPENRNGQPEGRIRSVTSDERQISDCGCAPDPDVQCRKGKMLLLRPETMSGEKTLARKTATMTLPMATSHYVSKTVGAGGRSSSTDA